MSYKPVIKNVSENLWIVEHPLRLMGAQFGERMTIIRLRNGDLWLHSLVPFDDSLPAMLGKLGSVRHLVVPSCMHNLNSHEWQQAYPEAAVYAPASVSRVKSFISIDERQSPAWEDEIAVVAIDGMPKVNEVVFVHLATGTLIITDLAFNIDNDINGWTTLFFKLYGALGKFGPTKLIRAMIKDEKAFASSLQKVMEYDFDRIILAHGSMIEQGGKQAFISAFNSYLNCSSSAA